MAGAIVTVLFIAGLIIFFIRETKKGSKWGLNFKRSYCPVCQTRLPLIRKPANRQQALWGGTTCPNCKTELDKFGKVVY